MPETSNADPGLLDAGMLISTTGAYRTLRSKADLGICICPFCPAIRRGISQLWSSFLPMEGQFCVASISRLRELQAPGHSFGGGISALDVGKASMRSSVKETHRLYEQLRRLVIPIPRLEGCDISRSADPRQMSQPSNLELAPNAPPSI